MANENLHPLFKNILAPYMPEDNNMDSFERFQLERYGNVLAPTDPVNESEDDADIRFEKWQEMIEAEQNNY